MAKMYEFKVSFSSSFPVDMLRYDCCWPKSSEDAIKIAVSLEGTSNWGKENIWLVGIQEPTTDRWNSFNAKVVEVRKR